MFDVVIPEGGTTFLCSVPGHADGGMTGEVTVAGQGRRPVATITVGQPRKPMSSPTRTLPPTFRIRLEAPAALEGTVHDIELVIEEKPMTVAQGDDGGFVQAVWTFNGTVPGPVIRVKVGDSIRVHLVNPETSQVAHSIDFHASQVAWNDEMTSINPGEEKVYEWTAEYAGVWMYHCGTSPALHHIANGMYGMVIVEPAEGLAPVDAEFAIVQSEWYLGPQGEPASPPRPRPRARARLRGLERRREPVRRHPDRGRGPVTGSASSS